MGLILIWKRETRYNIGLSVAPAPFLQPSPGPPDAPALSASLSSACEPPSCTQPPWPSRTGQEPRPLAHSLSLPSLTHDNDDDDDDPPLVPPPRPPSSPSSQPSPPPPPLSTAILCPRRHPHPSFSVRSLGWPRASLLRRAETSRRRRAPHHPPFPSCPPTRRSARDRSPSQTSMCPARTAVGGKQTCGHSMVRPFVR